jgi:hypothetical protein
VVSERQEDCPGNPSSRRKDLGQPSRQRRSRDSSFSLRRPSNDRLKFSGTYTVQAALRPMSRPPEPLPLWQWPMAARREFALHGSAFR